jgi:hypothetical protein
MNSVQETKLKAVYTIVEREGARDRWVRIGIGFVNRDGSINVRLDAAPVNGKLHVRDHQRKERESDSSLSGWASSHPARVAEGRASVPVDEMGVE